MSITIYGIKNCDTMKKARNWLDDHGVAYIFHDYKTAGAAATNLKRWCEALGWEAILNRNGTTFRSLAEAEKTDLTQAKAINLMQATPSMIKRPILEGKDVLLAGFKPEIYAANLR